MYTNPVLNVVGVDQGDPAILRYRGVYYLYHSGQDAIPVYTSIDLVHWEAAGHALHPSPDPNHWAATALWAPEVLYAEGFFYMYVAGAALRDGDADDSRRHIGVAIADHPLGPFQLHDQPLTTEWSIDAHPFLDSDGTWYMFYNVRNDSTRGPDGVIGCGNVVDKMLRLTTLQGSPSLVCRPEFPWEGTSAGDWFWNEGPFVLKRLGTYYQMYSGGCFYQPTYHIAYATSKICHGPNGMADASWEKFPAGTSRPILASSDEVWGPGHHVVTKGPNGVDDYVVYHGHVGDDRTRTTYIDRLFWHGDTMVIAGPHTHWMAEPAPPTLRIGQFLVTNTHTLGVDVESYLFEFWVQLEPTETFTVLQSGRSLLDIQQQDDSAHLHFVNGDVRAVPAANAKWQCYRLVKNHGDLQVFWEEHCIWHGSVASSCDKLALASSCGVMVAGLLLTEFFSDVFVADTVGKASSSMVLHTLRTELGPWSLTTGSVGISDTGIYGHGAVNTLERCVSADGGEWQCVLGQQGCGSIELPWIKIAVNNHKRVVRINDEPYDFEPYDLTPWNHLRVRCSQDSVEVWWNHRSLGAYSTVSSPNSGRIRITLDNNLQVNHLTMVKYPE